MRKILPLLFIFSSMPVLAFAQQAPELTGRTTTVLYLSLAVLLFGLIILGLEIGVMFKVGKGWGTNSIRISGLFLNTAGYSQNQIAPMVGLLGTIAGYLLGKSDKPE